ncbi:MAG TPA: FGGY-family carbohydrate kinase [Acidimicrobiales bacterium]|jgi:xylulokinase|nr:FGGY-family carbohydrate kinase [Acidimicrobiales bacterium]
MRSPSAPTLAAAAPVALRALPEHSPDETYVLAVDLGTGGPKVAVISATGRIAAHAFEKVGIALGTDGSAEQSPDEWWAAVVASAQRAMAESGVDPDQVVGVGCTAQWSGTVPIGADGLALGPAISWMDSRGSDAVKDTVRGALNVQGYSASKLTRWVRKTGGIPSLSGKDPVGHIHFLRAERPEVYAATAVFLEPVDYLNLRLTGLARASHDTITLHWVTDNRDINAVAYDDSLFEMAGLERRRLPELVPTGSILGGLTPSAASELGLRAGTPVVAGTGDLHSAAVGSGAVDDFDGHLYIGTSSWISCHVPFKKTDALTNIASIPSGLPGRYLVADEHETGGACLTWLRDNLLYPDDGLGGGVAPDDLFDRLNVMAAAVPPGAHGVMFTPWLNGERSPVDDHTIRGGFHNISLSSTRSHLVRAVFEGVALNSAWLLGAVEKYTKRRFGSLAFVGGGANSDIWSQIHADAMGRTIRQIADPVLANVRGAGLITLLALGRITLADIPATVQVKATYTPDQAAGELYATLLKEFINLYKETKGIHKRLNGGRLGAHPA